MATTIPRPVRDIMSQSMGFDSKIAMRVLRDRSGEINSATKMKLMAIASDEYARRSFDSSLDAMWRKTKMPKVDEVVIGGGLHAAIYCNTRVAMGYPRPLVIEMSDHPGGTFAAAQGPAFYLNSRNRPGPLSLPGMGALNVLPESPIQPCDLSGDEYQRNHDIAFCIRASLAMSAYVMSGAEVTDSTEDGDGGYIVYISNGERVQCNRIILAAGLGSENRWPGALRTDGRVMQASKFLARMGRDHFPLRGMHRVAVIGAGDTGKIVVEALTGQGPPRSGMDIASLDFVDRIDWYGMSEKIGTNEPTRETWRQSQRSRYDGIGRLLPCTNGKGAETQRLFANVKAGEISDGYNVAYVNGVPYDHVIVCLGYTQREYPVGSIDAYDPGAYEYNGRNLGRRYNSDVFYVGPCSGLGYGAYERNVSGSNVENKVAIFRYADRTATLASILP